MLIDELNELIEKATKINELGHEKKASSGTDVVLLADEIINEINSGKIALAHEVDFHSMLHSMEKQACSLAREIVGLRPTTNLVLSGPEILDLMFPV